MSGVLLVTGATGFVGGAVARLALERGFEVHALARASSARGALAGLPIAWHTADLAEPGRIAAAIAAAAEAARARGCGLRVVHSAALISYATRDTARQWATNVEGTRHVLEAVRAAKVERLCFVSSVVAVGPSPDGRPLDESAPFHGARVPVDYMHTKRAAEELVLAARDELDVVVVNPGAVFGPAPESSNTVRFLREVAAGRKPLAAPPGSIAVVGIRDTALGVLLALERGRRGERYLLVERSLPARELFGLLCGELGQSGVRFSVPRWIWPLVVAGARLVDRLRPLELTPPQALAMLGTRLVFDGAKARRELGWEPQPFAEVLRETVLELRQRGSLPAADGNVGGAGLV